MTVVWILLICFAIAVVVGTALAIYKKANAGKPAPWGGWTGKAEATVDPDPTPIQEDE